MTRNAPSCSTIIVSVVVAAAFFIGAIITQNFWLSLGLGIAGVGTFAYAVFLLREARKRLPNEEKHKPQ